MWAYLAISWSIVLGLAQTASAADGPQQMPTTQADWPAEAKAILRGLEPRPGVCLFLGDSDGLAVALARQSQLTV